MRPDRRLRTHRGPTRSRGIQLRRAPGAGGEGLVPEACAFFRITGLLSAHVALLAPACLPAPHPGCTHRLPLGPAVAWLRTPTLLPCPKMPSLLPFPHAPSSRLSPCPLQPVPRTPAALPEPPRHSSGFLLNLASLMLHHNWVSYVFSVSPKRSTVW